MPRSHYQGAFEAFATGALLGLGIALYYDDDARRMKKRAAGCGTVFLSGFLWYATVGLRDSALSAATKKK